jgi:hypothetical protein
MNGDDDCQTCTFWQRVGRYALLRLKEPTTWTGLCVIATGVGLKIAPELQTQIITFGAGISSILLMAAREGRNKPDNPTAMSTIKGEMPEQKPAIVPPPKTDDQPTVAIDPEHVPVGADGELQAPKQ